MLVYYMGLGDFFRSEQARQLIVAWLPRALRVVVWSSFITHCTQSQKATPLILVIICQHLSRFLTEFYLEVGGLPCSCHLRGVHVATGSDRVFFFIFGFTCGNFYPLTAGLSNRANVLEQKLQHVRLLTFELFYLHGEHVGQLKDALFELIDVTLLCLNSPLQSVPVVEKEQDG